MSKEMTNEELNRHCVEATDNLKNAMLEFAASDDLHIKKRPMLLGYWLKSYTYFFKNEDSFQPSSVYKLKRGSVVQVEFGYRVGRELGGRHYAVVLDRDNKISRNTVTVVPLGSIKENDDEEPWTVKLNDGLFSLVNNKLNVLLAEGHRTINEADAMNESIANATPEEAKELRTIQRAKIDQARQSCRQAKEWLAELSHMKLGSKVLVDQIATVSKMRISQPKKKSHPLFGIRLSAGDMDLIDKKIVELYFSQKFCE